MLQLCISSFRFTSTNDASLVTACFALTQTSWFTNRLRTILQEFAHNYILIFTEGEILQVLLSINWLWHTYNRNTNKHLQRTSK